MTDLDYKMFDTDHHYYEATDAFTRHMDPKMAPRAMQWADIDGHKRLIVGGKINHFFASPTCDPTWRPESLLEMMRGNNPDKLSFVEEAQKQVPARPDFFDRDKRLALMDDQGIEGILAFPSLAMGMEEELASSDPQACVAAFRAFNRWVEEDWGFNYKNRIFAPPVITLVDPDSAVEELEWALSRGARVVALRPGPIAGPGRTRSPGDPIFDPFWARVNEAGIVVGFHAGLTIYQSHLTEWGEAGGFDFQDSSFMEVVGLFGKRCISDTMAALICHGVFERFPKVRVCTVENGGDWVLPLLTELKRVAGMLPNTFREDPVESFKRHIWVSCTPAFIGHGEMLELRDKIGVENVMMGSDYPHPEGLERAADLLKELDGFSAEETKAVMRDNALALLQPPSF